MVDVSLDALFRPRGVAVMGASPVPGKIGNLVVRALVGGGFDGPVYPVNRGGGEVLGNRGFVTIAEVPDPVDLAVVALPADAVADAIDQCAQRGVRAPSSCRPVSPRWAQRASRSSRTSHDGRLPVVSDCSVRTARAS